MSVSSIGSPAAPVPGANVGGSLAPPPPFPGPVVSSPTAQSGLAQSPAFSAGLPSAPPAVPGNSQNYTTGEVGYLLPTRKFPFFTTGGQVTLTPSGQDGAPPAVQAVGTFGADVAALPNAIISRFSSGAAKIEAGAMLGQGIGIGSDGTPYALGTFELAGGAKFSGAKNATAGFGDGVKITTKQMLPSTPDNAGDRAALSTTLQDLAQSADEGTRAYNDGDYVTAFSKDARAVGDLVSAGSTGVSIARGADTSGQPGAADTPGILSALHGLAKGDTSQIGNLGLKPGDSVTVEYSDKTSRGPVTIDNYKPYITYDSTGGIQAFGYKDEGGNKYGVGGLKQGVSHDFQVNNDPTKLADGVEQYYTDLVKSAVNGGADSQQLAGQLDKFNGVFDQALTSFEGRNPNLDTTSLDQARQIGRDVSGILAGTASPPGTPTNVTNPDNPSLDRAQNAFWYLVDKGVVPGDTATTQVGTLPGTDQPSVFVTGTTPNGVGAGGLPAGPTGGVGTDIPAGAYGGTYDPFTGGLTAPKTDGGGAPPAPAPAPGNDTGGVDALGNRTGPADAAPAAPPGPAGLPAGPLGGVTVDLPPGTLGAKHDPFTGKTVPPATPAAPPDSAGAAGTAAAGAAVGAAAGAAGPAGVAGAAAAAAAAGAAGATAPADAHGSVTTPTDATTAETPPTASPPPSPGADVGAPPTNTDGNVAPAPTSAPSDGSINVAPPPVDTAPPAPTDITPPAIDTAPPPAPTPTLDTGPSTPVTSISAPPIDTSSISPPIDTSSISTPSIDTSSISTPSIDTSSISTPIDTGSIGDIGGGGGGDGL